MKLIIREYLSFLKESGELDVLLPNLLFAMGYTSISKPQAGRQDGVDSAHVGTDDKGRNVLILLVVKQKNITRDNWNSGKNSPMQTLDEVREVYLTSRVHKKHKDYVKKIVLCTNGELKQTADRLWRGHQETHQKENVLEYDFWGGDEIAERVEKHLLNEYIFPEEDRSDFRKSLALIGESDYDLKHYFRLLRKVLFYNTDNEAQNKKYPNFKKALDTANLLLNVSFKWAESENNLRNALLASERTVLWGWELLINREYTKNQQALKKYAKLLITHSNILIQYFRKLQPQYQERHGLSACANEHILVVENVFKEIGIVGTIGCFMIITRQPEGSIEAVYEGLASIITNNPCSGSPCYDYQAIDIGLALLFLVSANKQDFAKNWINDMCLRLAYAYRVERHFPVDNDSFDTAVDLTMSHWKGELVSKSKQISALLPMLAEWCCILKDEEGYKTIRYIQQNFLKQTNFQLWYPDSKTESVVYRREAQRESGNTQTTIILPETIEEYIEGLNGLDEKEFIAGGEDFSAINDGFPYLLLTAFRHYRTPIFPFIWQLFFKVTAEGDQSHPTKG